MPLFYFSCKCGTTTRKLLPISQAEIQCQCGQVAARVASGGSSKVVETLDNGLMPKSLERLADAERLFSEHLTEKPDPDTI